MTRAEEIRGEVEVSSKILDCADVGTCGMVSVITTLEFFQHYFAKMGHRNTSCDPHLHQVIEQPMLPTSREASAARAATSKREYRYRCPDLQRNDCPLAKHPDRIIHFPLLSPGKSPNRTSPRSAFPMDSTSAIRALTRH